ncbi:hypothetical protein JCM10213_009199 [Rhodosporidiobolus nylandii]
MADPADSSSNSAWVNTIPAATQIVPSVGLDGKPTKSASPSSDNGGDDFPLAAIAVLAIVAGLAVLFATYKLYRWFSARRGAAVEPEPYPETRGLAGAMSPGVGGGSTFGFGSQMSLAGGGFDSMGRRSGSGLGFARSRQASWGGDSWAGQGGGYYNEKGDLAPSPPFASSPMAPGSPSSRQGSPGPGGSSGSLAAFPSQGSMPASATRGSLPPPRRSFYSTSTGPQLLHSRTASSFSSSAMGGLPGMVYTHSGNRLAGAPHSPHSRIEVVPPLPLAPPPGTVIATDKSTLDFAPSSGIGAGGQKQQGEEWLDVVQSAGAAQSSGDVQERLNPAFDGAYHQTVGASPYPQHLQQHSFPPSASSSSGSSRSSSAPRAGPSGQRKASSSNLRGPPSATATRSPVSSPPAPQHPFANSSSSTISSTSRRPLPAVLDVSGPVSAGASESEPRSPLEKLQRQAERQARGLSMQGELGQGQR